MIAANTLFLGRADYTGPIVGPFGFLHHDRLCEYSHNGMERVAYVNRNKPLREIATRLHNMIYLGDCESAAKRISLDIDYEAKLAPLDIYYGNKLARLDTDYKDKRDADYWAKLHALDADYLAKYGPLDADYRAKLASLDAEILTYIRQHIPDCAWDGKELAFK